MISRLTTTAALFAVFATATLAYAVEAPAARATSTTVSRSATVSPDAAALPVVVLPTVEVTGKRVR